MNSVNQWIIKTSVQCICFIRTSSLTIPPACGLRSIIFIDCTHLTNTQEHSSRLTPGLPLYHITLPPTGRTMNLHSERYGQRWRMGPRLHNDCSESVLVMWFVTPSALPLMWLRDGLRPAVSNEMVASDRRSRAQTRKCMARLQSVIEYLIQNMMTVKMSGDCGGVIFSVFVRVWRN